MFFRIVATFFFAVLYCVPSVAQTKKFLNQEPYSANKIASLSQKYLGFNVYDLPLTERLKKIVEDSSNLVDTIVPATKDKQLYIRVSQLFFNPFVLTPDSMKLIIYESLVSINYRPADTVIVIHSIGIFEGKNALKDVKEEFERVAKDVGHYLDDQRHDKNRRKDSIQWKRITFGKWEYPLLNVKVGWKEVSEAKATVFISFTLPMAVKTSSE